jgi:hypothetical protein
MQNASSLKRKTKLNETVKNNSKKAISKGERLQ